MRTNVCNYLIGVMAVGSVMFSTGVTATSAFVPEGVPVGDAPLSCTTENYQVDAVTGPDGEFPVMVNCTNSAGKCSKYEYLVTVKQGAKASLSQSFFAVSADQEIDDLISNGSNPWVPTSLGDGDSQSNFLVNTQHEYPVRFNAAQDKVEGTIVIDGGSSPRISTAYMRGGKLDESCLIAGPGVPGNAFAPKTVTKDVVAVGGKCKAKLHYNGKGEVVNITNVEPAVPGGAPCYAGKPDPTGQNGKKLRFLLGDQPIQAVDAPNGITFGTGTTIVYLPYGWAICTDSDCPGSAYYIWVY